jgi:crotonobetainyl-CoA:carnitine CoA-transferase CaiB-like acyl-CoA transferase
VRGGGNQAYTIGSAHAVMGALTALLSRDAGGPGQQVDVNMHAAANVTTEGASLFYMSVGLTLQRQTGRHAAPQLTLDTQVQAADGRWINTGILPRTSREFEVLVTWLKDLGLASEFSETVLLEMGAEREFDPGDPVSQETLSAARGVLQFIASRLTAYEFFTSAQSRGIACGIIYAPEEVLADPHFLSRRLPVDVHHDTIGRTVTYPGAAFVSTAAPVRTTSRAPHIGEHDDELLPPLRANP